MVQALVRFVFCLGLLLGQTAAVVHASQHEILAAADDATCQVCAIAHAAGGASTLRLPTAPEIHARVAVITAAVPAVDRGGRHRLPFHTGPPAALV